MKKITTITFRASEKTLENIKNIKKQLIEEHGYLEEELNDSKIIRMALEFFNNKIKYTIFEDKIDWYKKHNK